MSLWFHVRTIPYVLRGRPGAAVRMVLAAFAGTLWILMGGVWFLAVLRDVDRAASEVTVDFTISPNAPGAEIQDVSDALRSVPDATSVRYLPGHAVWQEFSKSLAIDDTDLAEVAEVPGVIRLQLKPKGVTSSRLTEITESILADFPIVTDALWPVDLVVTLSRRRAEHLISSSVAAVVSLALFSLFMIQVFRTGINMSSGEIPIAGLQGAGASFVAFPQVVISAIAIVLGTMLATVTVVVAWQEITKHISWYSTVNVNEVVIAAVLLAGTGIVLTTINIFITTSGLLRRVVREDS